MFKKKYKSDSEVLQCNFSSSQTSNFAFSLEYLHWCQSILL